jgi:NAD(P)-dependent dehydrogenase (short-subunit alcohol dehydrogenase family)
MSEAELAGRVAVITGGGQGIGLAVARALAQDGADVVIADLIAERGDEAAAGLRSQGLSAWARTLDVTKSASCAAVAADVVERRGTIDILVNNAGVAILGPSEDLAEEDWRLQIDVMLTGTFLMTQAVVRTMIERRRGAIVNIASIGGMGGWPMRTAYNPAKAGVINLTEVLATEWAHLGIRVNAVSPGVTRTAMVEEAIGAGRSSRELYLERTPMRRMAEVEEIASAVAFLASDRASFITGANLRVDGGWVPWGNPDAKGFPERS